MPTQSFDFFGAAGILCAVVGLILMIVGATKDISVPTPPSDLAALPDRVVNTDLMFASLSDQIEGGFLLVTGAIFLAVGRRKPDEK